MKHVHYDMIVAKAANFELIQFVKIGDNWEIVGSHDNKVVSFASHYEYFLCLPQHKEACLHWLNGGEIQDLFEGSWTSVGDYNGEDWEIGDNPFMNEEFYFRIKPKKEKRWIGHHEYGHTTIKTYTTKDDALSDTVDHDKWQFIEIEVEV